MLSFKPAHTHPWKSKVYLLFAYFEEDLNSVDEEKDDNDEHEEGVAAVEDVSVELALFMFNPDLKLQSN